MPSEIVFCVLQDYCIHGNKNEHHSGQKYDEIRYYGQRIYHDCQRRKNEWKTAADMEAEKKPDPMC